MDFRLPVGAGHTFSEKAAYFGGVFRRPRPGRITRAGTACNERKISFPPGRDPPALKTGPARVRSLRLRRFIRGAVRGIGKVNVVDGFREGGDVPVHEEGETEEEEQVEDAGDEKDGKGNGREAESPAGPAFLTVKFALRERGSEAAGLFPGRAGPARAVVFGAFRVVGQNAEGRAGMCSP